MKGGAFHKNKSKTDFPFCFLCLYKECASYASEMLDFFVYFSFCDIQVFGKAPFAKVFFRIAVDKPSVNCYFVEQQHFVAIFTAGHIKASLFLRGIRGNPWRELLLQNSRALCRGPRQ